MFQYDAENRLTYYQSPTASSSFVLNGMGLRVEETDSGASGEHDYLHDGFTPASGLLVDSNRTGGNLFQVYTPGIDQYDAATSALHLMAVDALGTVRGFINDNSGQAVTDTFGAYAFGAPRTRTGSDAFSLAWGGADGYQTDPNGLVLLGNRVYHVYTGRFLTRDPAHAGSNDYEYCYDNPLKHIDPTGLEAAPFQMPGDSSEAQIEAQTIRNGGQPGETYDVKKDGKKAFSFTISSTSGGSGIGESISYLGQFLRGLGSSSRYYGASSTQSREMRRSVGFRSVLDQIAAGKIGGSVGTFNAAIDSFVPGLGDGGSNGTENEVGAYTWGFTDPNNPNAGIDIYNATTVDSAAYHIPGSFNGVVNSIVDSVYNTYSSITGETYVTHDQVLPETEDSGSMKTIQQVFHINFP